MRFYTWLSDDAPMWVLVPVTFVALVVFGGILAWADHLFSVIGN